MKKNNKQTQAQEARNASFRAYKKRKKMRDWIEKNGGHNESRDEAAIEEWLKNNEIKICPPFGHNDPQWGSLAKGNKNIRRKGVKNHDT